MLITPVTMDNIGKWLELWRRLCDDAAAESIAQAPDSRNGGIDVAEAARRHEACMAIDRVSGACLGAVTYSRAENRITFLGVSDDAESAEAADKLVAVALNQLDAATEVSASAPPLMGRSEVGRAALLSHGFAVQDVASTGQVGREGLLRRPSRERRKGESFHHDLAGYMAQTEEAGCCVCLDVPGPAGMVIIGELESSWVEASIKAQGCLWGKCHVLSKKHFVELHDVPAPDLADFMADVQSTGRALKAVSGAVKINYEIHANTLPHLHVHLFPRYVDDPFPSGPIDFARTEPSPYRDRDEFDFFVAQMRRHLGLPAGPDPVTAGNGHTRPGTPAASSPGH
jgi:diadenosine tetraphosphate (Ap4A) HIT family hydrolase